MAFRGGIKLLTSMRCVTVQFMPLSASANYSASVLALSPCMDCCRQQVTAGYSGIDSGFRPRYRFLSSRSSSSSGSSSKDDKGAPKSTPVSSTDIKEQMKHDVSSTTALAATVKAKLRSQRAKTDFTKSYTANIFLTASRAMDDYLLTPGDLDKLKSAKRRSPYPDMKDLTVYLRRDVEQVAIHRFGSLEKLAEERKRRSRHPVGSRQWEKLSQKYALKDRDSVLKNSSGRVVLFAVATNFVNLVVKMVAFYYTGSYSMFAESIHSAADLINQLILAVGFHQSLKKPDMEHPYGWANFRPVACLISGVGIFCLGAGLSWYHGLMGLLHPQDVVSQYWAIAILAGSFISEGATLMMAAHHVKNSAKQEGMTMSQFVWQGMDPSTSVVLLEDLAAVMGVVVAASCMGITYHLGNPIADAVGSIIIGSLLASVASIIIYTNTVALVGRSILPDKRQRMMVFLEDDRMIRAVHDVKATDMGGASVRFKAEVDFDGKEIARLYLEKHDIEIILQDMRKVQNLEEVETFMLLHGEKIVDSIGAEVDRIEKNLKKKYPEIAHVDLVQL